MADDARTWTKIEARVYINGAKAIVTVAAATN